MLGKRAKAGLVDNVGSEIEWLRGNRRVEMNESSTRSFAAAVARMGSNAAHVRLAGENVRSDQRKAGRATSAA